MGMAVPIQVTRYERMSAPELEAERDRLAVDLVDPRICHLQFTGGKKGDSSWAFQTVVKAVALGKVLARHPGPMKFAGVEW